MGAEIFGTIILWILGLLVLHFVIYTAVRDGINKSVVGQYINETKRYLSRKGTCPKTNSDNQDYSSDMQKEPAFLRWKADKHK
ncbi:hypothetical protein AB5N96_08210 [Chryseomicrobium imtechense]